MAVNAANTAPLDPGLVDPLQNIDPARQALLEELRTQGLLDTLGVQLVDISSGVQAEALDSADEHLRQLTSQPGVRGFIGKIWYGTFAREFVRQREVQRSRREILGENNKGNLYARHGGTQEQHAQAAEAVVTRFTSSFVHQEAGEANEALRSREGGVELEAQIHDLIARYARGEGNMDAAGLEEQKNRLLFEFGGAERRRTRERNVGLLWADNIVTVAQNAKKAYEHLRGLDNVDEAEAMATITGELQRRGAWAGEANMGVRTGASRELTDRVMDRLYSVPGLNLVNEETLGIAAAAVITIGKFATKKAITAVGATVTMGAGSAVVAGLREHAAVGQERRLHSRQMAEGGEIDTTTGSRRRASMEETRYETKSCAELQDELRVALEFQGFTPNADRSALATALANLRDATAAVEARIVMSDRLNADLISFSSKEAVEKQRLDLDIALARAKARLNEHVQNSEDVVLDEAGIDKTVARDPAQNIDAILAATVEAVDGTLRADMTVKDQAFRRLRARRVASAALVGGLMGVAMGVGSQEVHALLDNTLQGVGEPAAGTSWRTELAALFRHDVLHQDVSHNPNYTMPTGTYETPGIFHTPDGNGALDLPPGFHVVVQNGHDVLMGPNNHTVGTLNFDAHGHLTAASQQMLEKQGFKFDVTTEAYDQATSHSTTTTVSADQYVAQHPSDFTDVQRQFWYDNNTPGDYDLNELGLWWGGTNGVDAHGNFVFNVSHMTAGGSFHDGFSANAPALDAQHQLYIAVSLDQASQNHVVLVPIDANGNAVFDPHNPIFHSMFKMENGHAVFTGGYAEVVQISGHTPDGDDIIRPLATVVGTNNPGSITTTTTQIIHTTGEHIVTHVEAPAPAPVSVETPVGIAPVIPIRARRGLEDLGTRNTVASRDTTDTETPPEAPIAATGVYETGPNAAAERWERWRRERSPDLRANPQANLDTGRELEWYRREQLKRRGQEYIDELDANVTNSVLREIGDETKALVCIPVAAANESENIFNTLSLYAQQDKEAVDGTVVILNVNWKQELEGDVAAMARIQKTHDEIERAKKAFPNLRIASFDKVWTPEFIQRRTQEDGSVAMYGEVIKVLYDTAAFAVGNAVFDGRRNTGSEALIITNDADAQGMDRHYLRRYMDSMAAHPTADIFSGIIRWGTQEYEQYPGYGLASGFYAVINMVSARQGHDISTTGPNAAFRVSAYAATGGCEDSDSMGAGADAILGQRVMAARRDRRPTQASTGSYGMTGYMPVYAPAEESAAPNREVAKHVVGAQIDSAADRLLAAYKRGQWIAEAWNSFNVGGYQDRSALGASAALQAENPATDIDDIVGRVTASVEGFVNHWYRDPAMAASALALYFGMPTDDAGNVYYTTRWEGTPGWGGDGTFHIDITDLGKKRLQTRLIRDLSGRPDPYGRRLRRKLYSEVQAGDRHRALATPRFVSHTDSV